MHITVMHNGLKSQFEAIAKDSLKRDQLRAMHKGLTIELKSLKTRYSQVCEAINRNLSGSVTRYGKPKLSLSLEQLAQHMGFVEERARITQAAQLLAPLYRRLRILLDQETCRSRMPPSVRLLMIRNKADWLADVFVVAHNLAPNSPQLAVERLSVFVTAYPHAFPEVGTLAQGSPAGRAKPVRKSALYHKIVQAVELTPAEQRVLAKALTIHAN